jgi:hypothetical protein
MIHRRPLSLRNRSLLLTARCLLPTVFFLLTAHCSLLTVYAQSATATLSGTVEDQNGAVVPGASVTVSNTATSLERRVTTNDQGYFTVPLLPPSTYTVRAEHQGFAPVQIEKVILNVGDQKALQIRLQAGDINATVQVSNEAPLINESPAVGTVVDRQFVENIPLNGRSFQSLLTLTPGVVAVPGAATGKRGEFSVNGQRTESNYYTVDGVSANTGTIPATSTGLWSGASPGETALGTTQSLVSVDALQEFRVQTSSYSAELGRTPGGQIALVTRAGTNDWHGSVFDYLRNGVFDANNWFNNANRLTKTSERQNDFGGTFGGPVLLPRFGEGGRQPWYNGRNRTFFFFSYEGLRLSTPQPAQTTFVPDLCLRGIVSQCIGTDKPASAALQPFLNAFPVPNGPEVLANGQTTGSAQFVTAFSTPGKVDATAIRIDHSFNNKLTLFGRYSDSPSQALARGASFVTLSNPQTNSNIIKTLTIGTTTLLTSALTNEFRYNYTRNQTRSEFTSDNFGGAVPININNITDSNGLVLDNFQVFLFFGGNPQLFIASSKSTQRQANFVDTATYSLANHSLKFGVDYRRLITPYTVSNLAVSGIFNSKTVVQQGLVSSATVSSQVGLSNGPVYKNLSLFVQDEWRTTQRLNLSLGLRWEVNPPPKDAFGHDPYTLNQISNLASAQLAPRGTPLWKTTYNNFAPRLGVAYRLRQTSGRETVIRGGFGVFYDLGTTYASQGYNGPGILARSALANVPFPLTSAQLTLPPPSVAPPYGATVVGFDPNLKLPYTFHWSASVEQGIGKSQVFTATYVGSAGRRLLFEHQVRPAVSGNTNFTSTGAALIIRNGATSDYDALQLKYQRRLSRGLQVLTSYTWSHSIDEASVNQQSLSVLLRSSSDFDVRHNFQAAVTYDIPNTYQNPLARALLSHWALDSRITARSALPFEVTSGTFVDATGTQQVLRADLVSGQPIYISDSTAPGGRVVNFNAFTQPTTAEKNAGNFGSAPRNLLRGFSAWQMDFAVRREFPIHERLKLQFRAEAFNLFNHPIFGAIQNNLTTGSTLFGRATGSLNNQLGGLNALYQQGGPRSFQFALKLTF